MSMCPVCNDKVDADEQALNHHVNAHFEPSGSGHAEKPRNVESRYNNGSLLDGELSHHVDAAQYGPDDKDDSCMVCDYPLAGLGAEQRRTHINACLDEQSRGGDHTREDDDAEMAVMEEGTMRDLAQDDGDDWVAIDWDGPAKPGGWSDWVNKKVGKGDKWWDPVDGPTSSSDVPSNISPGASHTLRTVLRSPTNRLTRRAVLCTDITHIRHSFQLDLGWGCGYRNALMCISALLLARPQYRGVFSRDMNGANPGVRRIQGWIEEGWGNGFDREGSGHFRGKILGTRKWIGTSDLYAMFTSKGIPCELFDFPKPKSENGERGRPANAALIDWVMSYFSLPAASTTSSTSAFDVLMRSNEAGEGRGETVRKIGKLPLILQHSGHSRTIVGYEETVKGTINLLMFDPGRWLPKEIRMMGIRHLQQQREVAPTPPHKRKASDQSHHSVSFTRPYTNGASEPTHITEGEEVQEDEEKDEDGWVRKKMNKVLRKASRAETGEGGRKLSTAEVLSYFRVSADRLGKFKEYQILAFTGGPLLSQEERDRRKVVSSTPVR